MPPPPPTGSGVVVCQAEALDTRLVGVIRRLNEHRRRRALLLGFAQSPVDFTYALLASQVGGAVGTVGWGGRVVG